LKAFSLLRFFFALEKEMTRRHAQWLKENKTREGLESSNPALTPTATARTPNP
jgi:hypothetical protein